MDEVRFWSVWERAWSGSTARDTLRRNRPLPTEAFARLVEQLLDALLALPEAEGWAFVDAWEERADRLAEAMTLPFDVAVLGVGLGRELYDAITAGSFPLREDASGGALAQVLRILQGARSLHPEDDLSSVPARSHLRARRATR